MIKNGEVEEGTDSDLDELEALGEFCRKNDMTSAANYEYVTSKVDVESLIDCYCAGLYLGTWDWPNHNYLMWRNSGEAIEGNPYSDGKWRLGSFDFDYSVGLTYQSFGGVEGYQYDSFRKMDNSLKGMPTSIFAGLLKNPQFRQQFADRFYSYAYSVFEPSKMTAELDDEEIPTIIPSCHSRGAITTTKWRKCEHSSSAVQNMLLRICRTISAYQRIPQL